MSGGKRTLDCSQTYEFNRCHLFAGIAASVLHVISGPDHLADFTPLAIETRRKVWKIGLFWVLGI